MDRALEIGLARPADAGAIAAIYAPSVRESAVSFEFDPPDEAQMRHRVEGTRPRLPWLVARRGEEVLGYAYAAPYRARPAYQWSVEVSAYVAESARRQGVARRLYVALLAVVAAQGHATAYAGIVVPNPASVGLHAALGFTLVGTFRGVGFKLGAWRDVAMYERRITDPGTPPAPPIPLAQLPPERLRAALRAGG